MSNCSLEILTGRSRKMQPSQVVCHSVLITFINHTAGRVFSLKMPRKRKTVIKQEDEDDEAVTPTAGRPVRAARLNHRFLGTPKKSPESDGESQHSLVVSSHKKRRKKEATVAIGDLLDDVQAAVKDDKHVESEIRIAPESEVPAAMEGMVMEEEDVTGETEEGDPSEEIICIECPPMNAHSTPFILELPQLTRKVMLKAQGSNDPVSTSDLQETLKVFSSIQANLSQSSVSALLQRDPDWVKAITQKAEVKIEGNTLAGSSESFSAAAVRIQQLLAAEMSCIQTDGGSDNITDVEEATDDKAKLMIVEGGPAVCPFCQESFPSASLKREHVWKDHEPLEEIVTVPVFGSIYWEDVLQVVSSGKEEPERCTLCDFKGTDFLAHFKEKHGDAPLSCRYCRVPFEDKKRLRLHVLAHLEASTLVRCKYCDREGGVQSMKRHVSSKHEAEPSLAAHYSKVKRFLCPACSRRKFHDRNECIDHMTECTRSHHSDLDQYMVEIDPIDEADEGEGEEVEPAQEEVGEQQSNVRMSKCRSCSYSGSVWQVRSHFKRHHASRQHACPHCEVTFSTAFALNKHKQTHFDSKGALKPPTPRLNKLLKCKLCAFRSSRMGLMMHLSRAHGIKGNTEAESGQIFSCPHCGKIFTKQNAFNCHEWRCKRKAEVKPRANPLHSRLDEFKDVAEYIREANEEESKSADLGDAQVLRYDEGPLSKDQKRKIVSKGIEQLPELFPDNGFNVEMKHIFKCKDCPYVSTCNGTIIHRRRHHRQAQHKCPHCPKEYVMKCELDRHKASHYDADGNPTLKISKGGPAKEPSTYMIGNKCYQVAGKGKVAPYFDMPKHVCTECGYKGTYLAVSQHVRHEHLGTTMCCRFCEKVFLTLAARDCHEEKHRMPDGTIQPLGSKGGGDKRSFSCPQCGQMFRMKQHMERHLARKHSAKIFACDQCSNTYSLERDLTTHIRVKHTTVDQISCTLCGAEFACEAYLKNHHRRVHAEKQWLQCQQCQKLCKDSEALQRHGKIHRPDHVKLRHKCPECPKSFCSDSYLKDHLNVHSGDRPYECSDCSATFMTQSVFSRHKHKHKASIECPYDDCGARFRVLIDQVKHVNKMHADVSTYVCSHCGKLFLNKKRMLYHDCEKGLITVDGVKQEEGEVAAQQINTEDGQLVEEENLVYMCAQCDIIMSSWDEMEQHALTCEATETAADIVPVASEELQDSEEQVVIQEVEEGIFSVEMVELENQ